MKTIPVSGILAACSLQAGGMVLMFPPSDHFDNGEDGWIEGGNSNTPPFRVETGGPDGGPFLRNESPGLSPGKRMQMWNVSQWQGDYLGAGVTSISLDANNLAAAGGETLYLRIVFNGDGGWFVTEPTTLLPESGWMPLNFSIGIGDLVHAGQESGEYAETMENVTRMQIISLNSNNGFEIRSGAGLAGDIVEASLGLDNIRAVQIPESGSLALLGMTAGLFFRRKR